MHADATNRIQQITRDLLRPIWRGHGTRDLLVRAPQQNREKSIRAMFFVAQRASKSGAVGARDLTRSVPRGTVNCARGGEAFMSRTISHARLHGSFGLKFCARGG